MALERKNIKIDEDRVQEVSCRYKEYGDFAVARSLRYVGDTEKKQRLERQECRYCFYYRGGGAGQAFTDWDCGVCGKVQSHANTATPCCCVECAKKYELCVECGGDIHQRVRRRKVIP